MPAAKAFALGYDVLREYKLQDWSTDHPSLKLVNHWKIPGIGGHDLQLQPDGKALLVTETKGSWIFDLEKLTFEKKAGGHFM